jgi:hypothetical protein
VTSNVNSSLLSMQVKLALCHTSKPSVHGNLILSCFVKWTIIEHDTVIEVIFYIIIIYGCYLEKLTLSLLGLMTYGARKFDVYVVNTNCEQILFCISWILEPAKGRACTCSCMYFLRREISQGSLLTHVFVLLSCFTLHVLFFKDILCCWSARHKI